MEGTWAAGHPGGMLGYTICLMGGIVRELMSSMHEPQLSRGIRNGLSAARVLHRDGYGVRRASPAEAAVVFPVACIACALAEASEAFADVPVPDPTPAVEAFRMGFRAEAPRVWTILKSRLPADLSAVAERIVKEGEGALAGVPLARLGALVTADRREIESYRTIDSRIPEYCRRDGETSPLSIAVFGPPGSGKSFGIEQIARSILPGRMRRRWDSALSRFQAGVGVTPYKTFRKRARCNVDHLPDHLGQLPGRRSLR